MEIDGFGSLVHPDDLDWIDEPNGAEHEQTHHPEETLYLPNVHGAIAFVGEATAPGSCRPIIGLSDWRSMQGLQASHRR